MVNKITNSVRLNGEELVTVEKLCLKKHTKISTLVRQMIVSYLTANPNPKIKDNPLDKLYQQISVVFDEENNKLIDDIVYSCQFNKGEVLRSILIDALDEYGVDSNA